MILGDHWVRKRKCQRFWENPKEEKKPRKSSGRGLGEERPSQGNSAQGRVITFLLQDTEVRNEEGGKSMESLFTKEDMHKGNWTSLGRGRGQGIAEAGEKLLARSF